MALEGNLSAFGLSEILQLIAVQQKSGMLSVNSDDRSMVMFFKNGSVVSTRDRRRRGYDPLKDYLTRYGILVQADLIKIMNLSSKSKLDMTEVIVSENFLSEEELRLHYRNQIQEATHEMLSWQQCSYKFIPSEQIVKGLKTWGEFNIEGLLMESMRRIDEFPQMIKEFPEPTILISRSSLTAPEDLSTNEKTVSAMLSQERTIEYLIAHGRMPAFEVYEALKHLKEKDLIEVHQDEPEPEIKASATSSDGRTARRLFRRFLATGCIFLTCGLVVYVWGRTSFQQLRPQSELLRPNLFNEQLARHRAEEKLRWLIEGYRTQYGNYPRTLTQLQETNFVSITFMKQLEPFSFRYHLTPGKNAYTLI
jgi:hypothetical protein